MLSSALAKCRGAPSARDVRATKNEFVQFIKEQRRFGSSRSAEALWENFKLTTLLKAAAADAEFERAQFAALQKELAEQRARVDDSRARVAALSKRTEGRPAIEIEACPECAHEPAADGAWKVVSPKEQAERVKKLKAELEAAAEARAEARLQQSLAVAEAGTKKAFRELKIAKAKAEGEAAAAKREAAEANAFADAVVVEAKKLVAAQQVDAPAVEPAEPDPRVPCFGKGRPSWEGKVLSFDFAAAGKEWQAKQAAKR